MKDLDQDLLLDIRMLNFVVNCFHLVVQDVIELCDLFSIDKGLGVLVEELPEVLLYLLLWVLVILHTDHGSDP